LLSGAVRLNPDAEVFKHHFSPIVILTTGRYRKRKLRQLQTIADEVKICGRREINFDGIFLAP